MAFRRKFKEAMEATLESVKPPDYVRLTYCVCSVVEGACGWTGWAIESAGRLQQPDGRPAWNDERVPAMDDLECPRCRGPLFRSAASVLMVPAADHSLALKAGVDYEVAETEYID